MDHAEARALLGNYRPGMDDPAEPRLAEALELAKRNPELGHWWAQRQAVDAAVAAKLRETAVPAALKADLLALGNVVPVPASTWRQTWRPALAGAAAAAVLTWLAALVFLRSPAPTQEATRPPLPPQTAPTPEVIVKAEPASLDDFRAEMVSFVRLTPSLDYESHDVDKLRDYLDREWGPQKLHIPAGLQEMPGMGCRVLSFRGHKVALTCFLRKNGQLIHFLVVDKNAMAPFAGSLEQPVQNSVGPWATAAWTDGDLVYMVAVKGDQELLGNYLHRT